MLCFLYKNISEIEHYDVKEIQYSSTGISPPNRSGNQSIVLGKMYIHRDIGCGIILYKHQRKET